MGILLSKKEGDKVNDSINKSLHEDNKRKKKEIKLLLLGTGESGKSTFAKQFKILHLAGFTKEELAHYRVVLHENISAGIATLIEQAPALGYTLSPDLSERVARFPELNSKEVESPLTPERVEDIKAIWADPAIQSAYARRAEFQLHGSIPYIVEHIDRIADPTTDVSYEDVLQCRIRTTGIVEIEFQLEGFVFRIMDVGGQRSERRKWIHCFDDVTAVIFCVALSEYDEKLVEDLTVNRMHEALELFEEIANHKAFEHSSIVLFLNKADLFKEKIKEVSMQQCFPDYTGGSNYESGTKFIAEKFLSKVHDKTKLVFPHITTATDTENVRIVFNTVRASILSNALSDLAL